MVVKGLTGRGRLAAHASTALGIALVAGALASPASAATATYSNAELIYIPDAASAEPYPSRIEVSGLPGNLTDLTVRLRSFIHDVSSDVGVALVAPGGQAMALMGCVGDDFAENATLTLTDSAVTQPAATGLVSTGTFRPADHCTSANDFTAPGPGTAYANPGPRAGGTATLNGTFGGGSPNGAWDLFVRDFLGADAGTFGRGWEVTISTDQPPDTQITQGPKDKTKKKQATFEFGSTVPGTTFQCSLNGGAFAPCTSPHTVTGKKGKNSFAVRATDEAGEVDPTPATDDWKVKKKKK